MRNQKDESNGGLVTCIRLSKETRDRLAQLGSKDQTFDDIINVTIDESLKPKKMSDDELVKTMSDESEKDFS